MTIKQLSYFIALADSQGFTEASKRLFISQSALSKTIKIIEEELGVPLVYRDSKRFILTSEGSRLYEQGKITLGVIEDSMQSLNEYMGIHKGHISVGVPPVISTTYFADIQHEFGSTYADIGLSLVETGANNVKNLVAERKVDIGVVILPFQSEGFDITPIFKSDNVLICGRNHRFASRKQVSFKELKDEKFIGLDSGYMLYNRIHDICQQVGFVPNYIQLSSQWDYVAKMCSFNEGVGILPRPILNYYKSDDICVLELTEPSFPWDIALITKKGSYISNTVKLFQNFVIDKSNQELNDGKKNTIRNIKVQMDI